MHPELPRSARLAWWATAWLRGHESADHVLDAMAELEEGHRVLGLDGGAGLVDLLASWRRAGATGVGLALPVEGDPVGLGGPRAFNDAALEAGEGAVGAGVGVVPELVGEVVQWRVLPADRRQLSDVGEADRGLRAALVDTADALAALDVARWRPEAADALMNLHHRPALDVPRGTPPRCAELAARGLQAWAIVDLALEDDGGAVTAYEIGRRRDSLRPLDRAARRAVVAACSPEVWPQ